MTAVRTMGLRTAHNSKAFLHLAKQRCDLTIEVISGKDQARIAYLAVSRGWEWLRETIIFDTGTGVVAVHLRPGNEVEREFSLNVGAARFTETYHLDQAVSPQMHPQARTRDRRRPLPAGRRSEARGARRHGRRGDQRDRRHAGNGDALT